MTNYKVTIIKDDGTISNRKENNRPEDFANVLISAELQMVHTHMSIPALMDMVANQRSAMGWQVAFVDESMTIVVTEMRG